MTLTTSQGTHFSDGLRSGPIYSTQLYTAYGYGVLHSPQNTYNITPSPPGTGGENTILNNVVATTTDGAVAAAGYLTLRGDNASTYYVSGPNSPNGKPLVQFDWPRVPTVTIANEVAIGGTRVTIFGNDPYGQPMQHTYVVEAIGTYPTVTQGVGADDGTITLSDIPLTAGAGVKAFYNVTGVHISAALPEGCSISVGASDIFGLPYVVNSKGVITSIQWGSQTGDPDQPIIPASELTTRVIGNPLTTVGIFIPADITNPSTAVSGDVRGLYAPSSPSAAQIIDDVAVDWKNLIFTAYIEGMDTWINQVASDQLQYQLQTGLPPQGIPISPLAPADAYGVPQFYTGVPS